MLMRMLVTWFFCPMRWARACAWRSFCGFQSLSKMMTVSAVARFTPRPPARVDNRKQKSCTNTDICMQDIIIIFGWFSELDGQNTLPQRSSIFTGCASQNISTSNRQLWRIDPSKAPLSVLSTVVFHLCCQHDIQTAASVYLSSWFTRLSLYSQQAGISGFWCHRLERPASTSHLRHHSRFTDDDPRPFCFPVPTKTLS